MANTNFNIEELAGLGVAEEDQNTIVVDENEEAVDGTTDNSSGGSEDPTGGVIEEPTGNEIEVEEGELDGTSTTEGTAEEGTAEKETSTETGETDGTSDQSDLNAYKEFAKTLANSEVLNFSEDQINNIESENDLKQAVEDQKNQSVNEILTDLDSKAYGAISHFMNGGDINSFIQQGGNSAGYTPYGEEKLKENEDAQKDVLKKYYRETTNFSDEKIDKMIDNLVELEGEAVEADKELQKIDQDKKEKIKEENKKKQEEQKKQQEEFAKKVEENLKNINEFVPGKTIRKDVKDKALKNADKVVQEINNNWSEYLPYLLMHYQYGTLKGDFSKVMKDAETKANSSFEKALKNKGKSGSTSSGKNTGNTDDFKAAIEYDKQRNKRK